MQAGRSGQAWASATQLKRVEAKLSAMEGSVLAAGAAAQGAAGAAEAAVERAAREVAREVAVEVQRGVMGPMGQTEARRAGLAPLGSGAVLGCVWVGAWLTMRAGTGKGQFVVRLYAMHDDHDTVL